jgi:hypothetical protein
LPSGSALARVGAMDDDVRACERAWRRDPTDAAACERAAAAYARVKRRPPADLAAHAIKHRLARTRVKLGPPLPKKELKAWERAHRVRLPEEYRQFLLVVGDGGDGPPHYGCWPLREDDLLALDEGYDWARGDHLRTSLRRPFPLTEAWAGFDEDPDYELDDDDWAELERQERGALTIGTDGCTYFWKLIVTGGAAGQVWLRDGTDRLEPRATDFLSWYGDWLDKRLAKSAAKRQRSSGSLPTSKQRVVGTKSVRRRPTARRRPTR